EDELGTSVVISGNTAIVGAIGDDDFETDSGSAYFFERPTDGWGDATETVKFTASDAAENGEFGISVAINGDAAIVGMSESAYVFTFE
ncbi:MAG: FG-GAP repeat protein, partial [Opitutales bacterium]|nr:FG-GAP repeat protein [Opitutales bacterium]